MPEEQIVLVGARDLDPPEITYLAGAQIRRAEVADLAGGAAADSDLAGGAAAGSDLAGPGRADPDRAGRGLADGDLPAGPLYVHLDLDVIDPSEVPGLRYPAPGGPTPGQVSSALRRLLGTGRVAAVGVACTWHPGRGAAAGLAPYLRAALAGEG